MEEREAITCQRCGEHAKVEHGRLYEVRCDRCHIAEYGETLEQAVRCFNHATP